MMTGTVVDDASVVDVALVLFQSSVVAFVLLLTWSTERMNLPNGLTFTGKLSW